MDDRIEKDRKCKINMSPERERIGETKEVKT
jgi:hypothetical protein